MAAKRASYTELARVLHAAEQPIYIVDAGRRLVFLNAACEGWLGRPTEGLLDIECRFSGPAADAEASLAAALCPPPEALAGRRTSAWITLPALSEQGEDRSPEANPPLRYRRAEFIPLSGNGEPAGLLALVGAADLPAPELPASPEDDRPADVHERLARFQRAMPERHALSRLVGDSPAARRIRAQVLAAATTTAAALIHGPQGSGRQHVAQVIHHLQAAPAGSVSRRLVSVACGLLPDEALDAAYRSARSAAAAGNQVTLLLERADELSAVGQARAWELMESGARLRVLATADRALVGLAAENRFRPDLAYALSTIVIETPPLTERLTDLPLFAQLFLEEANAAGPKQVHGFSSEALDLLAGYDWPENLDALQAVVRSAHAASADAFVQPGDLPSLLHMHRSAAARPVRPEETIPLDEFLGQIERELIERALAQADGNKAHAARLLGLTRPRLYRRLQQLGMLEEGEAE